MVVAQQGFRDEEFTKPHDLLAAAGAAITVAAMRSGTATGALGATITVNASLSDVKVANVDAVVFVGGPGAQVYFDNPTAHALARDAAGAGKIVAAICIAPATLANAGILKGKQATCFASVEATLRKGGAVLSRLSVVSDGNIITANGPAAATAFGEAILKALERR